MTLFELLRDSGAEVLVYDVGRRIGRLDDATWLGFERALLPYPRPLRRQAWVAVVQRPEPLSGDPVIWFLRLSLDERGLLVQAERDALLGRLAASAGAEGDRALRDNPHAFTPAPQRMALLHARLGADLDLPPSRHYGHALAYFRGEPGWQQWGFVGVQGIADVACRHDREPLVDALPALPPEPLVALCHCLDSQATSPELAKALQARLARELAAAPAGVGGEGDGRGVDAIAALVRGLASSAATPATRDSLRRLLDAPCAGDVEILAALSGRAWEALEDADLLTRFLVRLAGNRHGQAVFAGIVDDLLSLPSLATGVRQALRDPALPEPVRAAFGRMLKPA